VVYTCPQAHVTQTFSAIGRQGFANTATVNSLKVPNLSNITKIEYCGKSNWQATGEQSCLGDLFLNRLQSIDLNFPDTFQ
jgi:hypothetical protein